MHYTDEMIVDLRDIGEFNFEDCKTFAAANPSVTARSVMAKVKALGLVYTTKKSGSSYVMKKGDFFGDEIPFN